MMPTTMEALAALKICTSGANVVAIDFTLREGRSKKYYSELVKEINNRRIIRLEITRNISNNID